MGGTQMDANDDIRKREHLGSRLGFILLSAGCAIGLGNVWRFPYITGQNGGATFVLVYLVFLVMFGVPIMSMEFAVGRASQRSAARSFQVLAPAGTRWGAFGWFAMAGNCLLMMFYTTISGWMLAYLVKTARGDFVGATPGEIDAAFGALTGDGVQCVCWMLVVCAIGFSICRCGLQQGVERVAKVLMVALLLVMVALAVRSVTLPGAGAGLRFYLMPSLDGIRERGLWSVVYDAMGQAFFTLSLGIGSMAIFGSYLKKDRSLFGESVSITVLDTFVAIVSGLIIFPACFAYDTAPGAGPGLIFLTLPNIFAGMPGGRLWGTLFFVFMFFAAISTVIAVFENIVAFGMDLAGWGRKASVAAGMVAVPLLSLPCALGFNLWSGVQPMGAGSTILDLEDFVVSNNLLPLGSLVYLLFCLHGKGWGWGNFLAEVDAGRGLRFPARLLPYYKYVLPLLILAVFVFGYVERLAG
ncbi:MAG: sodium-dependent transporter [Acidobacteriota bacterium]|jgi:NSS family neurotransmitter:Na+ symporter|nr:sodium-dependent transporter [Acidobacteriota bacterium]